MGAWDLMESWSRAKGPLVRFRVLGTQGLIVSDPIMLKRIFQTRFKIYAKDLTMSYHPFMPILGTGLVTADGDLWQKQRMLMGPALRIDILDDIVGIAQRCADRLADKLEQHRWVFAAGNCLGMCWNTNPAQAAGVGCAGDWVP
jgi:cytochrome P450